MRDLWQTTKLPKRIGHYWICQIRDGVFRPMNFTKLINKGKISLPSISNKPKENKMKR
jgi:hypothetical protein